MCCPGTFQIYVMVAVAAVVIVYVYARLFAAIRENFEMMRGLLVTPERRDTFFRSRLEGYYKGRKTAFACSHFDKGERWVFSMEPANIPVPQKFFIVSYPRPTVHTQWKGRAVYYSARGSLLGGTDRYDRIYNDAEPRGILDELVEASQKVESGACAGAL